MIDVVDKATRSRMMSGIRSQNTRPEVELRQALHKLGLRYRLHVSALPGRPDIVFPRFRAAVQVHGCFWHRHRTESRDSNQWLNRDLDRGLHCDHQLDHYFVPTAL